jgi:hypothetical protein
MRLRSISAALAAAFVIAAVAPQAEAFCGFYVAKADSKLYNRASKVVLAWDAGRTVITMASDYEGDPREFALVVPVPTFIQREQINVADPALVDHLDAFTAPRLVEYFDDDPCSVVLYREMAKTAAEGDSSSVQDRARSLGVTVEAAYTVGEYDIVILSAEQSDGLAAFLTGEGYRIPEGAEEVLGSYIKQKMRFFVARVNLGEMEKLGIAYLRPLQVAYESPKFMLPIRLGTVNAAGPQELFLYTLTRHGRVETANYRTVKIPTDVEIPVYIEGSFGEFYKAMFDRAVEREDMRVVFQEYAWDLGWCDPCAADPIPAASLRKLGAFWLAAGADERAIAPMQQVFATRLHVRYDRERFPEDLMLMETKDASTFQGRYILRHPWLGPAECPEAEDYRRQLPTRLRQAARTLASLTGWPMEKIRQQMGDPILPGDEVPWWKTMWE